MFLPNVWAREIGLPERSFARVVSIVAAVAIVFWSTGASMVAIWNSSGTYSHGFFIVPAFLWLVWSRRRELARLPVRPTWWAYPLLVATGMSWLVGQWMALAQLTHFAMVVMVPLAIACVLGIAWVKALLFPLTFLFFAVPVGESLVPVLMDWTADFAVAALRASAVPVYREGLHFEIPSGKWSVVDSCSGIRYLFACLAVSSLYGWTIYRSNARRLMFVGMALLIALVANWVRAYAIVMLGHLSDNRIAAGVDHLVYGGLFFAVIMALVVGLGAIWREDSPSSPITEPAVTPSSESPPQQGYGAGTRLRIAPTALTVAVMLIWPLVVVGSISSDDSVSNAAREIRPRGGWTVLSPPLASWRPLLHNPVSVLSQSFSKDTRAVGIHIGAFRRPTPDSKLTSALNRLVEADGANPDWQVTQQGTARLSWAGESVDVRQAVLAGGQGRLLVWQWYWVDGNMTADPARAVWFELLARLRGRGEVSGWIAVYTRDTDDPAAAARKLAEFVADMAMPVQAMLRDAPPDSVASSRD